MASLVNLPVRPRCPFSSHAPAPIPLPRRTQHCDRKSDAFKAFYESPSTLSVSARKGDLSTRASNSTRLGSPATAVDPVRAVLFDMDGVLCNSEIVSRKAAAEVMAELYSLTVSPEEFAPFTGTGEANFLGGVARKYNAPFEVESCKKKFFEIYMAKYAVPGAGIGYPGAQLLVEACRAAGLRTAVASSADLIKVHANLQAADIPLDLFDTVVSADAFERLKPFPDIFLAAASQLGVQPSECVVIEDAVAGVQAARAAGMRVIGVTTTLAEELMTTAAPDAILSDISAVSVQTIVNLKLSLV